MRFKVRRLIKKLNIGLYIVLFVIIAMMFWNFTSGRDVDVKQISSADIGNNKVERILSKGNEAETEQTDNKETEKSEETEFNYTDDLDDIDSEDDEEDYGEDFDEDSFDSEVRAGDSFVINLENPDDYVNIREEADSNSAIIAKLYNGCGGTVITPGEEWSKVSSGEFTGYVKNELCIFGSAAESALNEGGYVATVTEDSIRVRAEKSTDSEILGLAGIGSKYSCNSRDTGDGWVEITFEGQTGYISSQFVTVDENEKSAVAVN